MRGMCGADAGCLAINYQSLFKHCTASSNCVSNVNVTASGKLQASRREMGRKADVLLGVKNILCRKLHCQKLLNSKYFLTGLGVRPSGKQGRKRPGQCRGTRSPRRTTALPTRKKLSIRKFSGNEVYFMHRGMHASMDDSISKETPEQSRAWGS